MTGDDGRSGAVVYPQAAVCDLIFWPERDSFLLIKKAAHKFDGDRWGCLGGKQEFNETAEQAAWREGREEGGPGINEQALRYEGIVGVVDDIIPEIRKHYVTTIHLFLVRPGCDPGVINAEPMNHADIRWFPALTLPPNVTAAFRKVIREVNRTVLHIVQGRWRNLIGLGFGWTDEDV